MSSGENGPFPEYTASGLACPLVRITAATAAICSGVVP